jgi:hypothetical protein
MLTLASLRACTDSIVDVRLLTKKGTSEPRGCAFLEVQDFFALQVPSLFIIFFSAPSFGAVQLAVL